MALSRALSALVLFSLAPAGAAQPSPLAESCAARMSSLTYPATRPNARFATEITFSQAYNPNALPTSRPALSFNGFDCANGRDCRNGNGLKQALEIVWGDSDANATRLPSSRRAFRDLYDLLPAKGPATNNYPASPGTRAVVEGSAAKFQSQALVALIAALWERQSRVDANYAFPRFKECLGIISLRDDGYAGYLDYANGLLEATSWLTNFEPPSQGPIDIGLDDDATKWRNAISNLARGIDLYLAYENLVEDLLPAEAPARTLSAVGKARLISVLKNRIEDLEDKGTDWQVYNRFEVEIGNWSLITRAVNGYAALALQNPGTSVPAKYHFDQALFAATSPGGSQENGNYYDYTSAGGLRTWAEGPFYLHYAVPSLVQFWHALRATGNWPEVDPYPGKLFRAPRFMNPLHFLADLTTPYGETPPFDDGNRHRINSAYLLAWSADYGDEAVGRKFAWISQAVLPIADYDAASAMMVLAIPAATGSTPPADTYGSSETPERTDQAILRRSGVPGTGIQPSRYYLALNAEGGVSQGSISRGHGHEQQDNMNLVYYVDKASVLMDAGYDSGSRNGSTWHTYIDQNVLRLHDAYCFGLRPTDYGGSNPLRDPPDSDGRGASALLVRQYGQIRHIYAAQTLNDNPRDSGCDEWKSYYERDVLMIGDNEYIIDINSNKKADSQGINGLTWSMHYVFDAPGFEDTAQPMCYGSDSPCYDSSRHRLSFAHLADERLIRTKPLRNPNTTIGLRAWLYPMRVEKSLWFSSEAGRVPGVLTTRHYSTRERNGENQLSSSIQLHSEPSRPSHTLASLIWADSATPAYVPQELSAGGTSQALVWKRNETEYDVLVVRSAMEGSGTTAPEYNLAAGGVGYPNVGVSLPAGKRFGFARIQITPQGPKIAPGYTLDLSLIRYNTGFSASASLENGSYRGTTTVTNGATLTVPSGVVASFAGTLNMSAGGTLRVRSGGKLYLAAGIAFEGRYVLVDAGGELIVEPGAVLTITGGGTGIYSSGLLTFRGTAASPIRVEGKNGAAYSYVYLYGSGANWSTMDHVIVKHSTYGIHTNAVWDLALNNITGTQNNYSALKFGGGSATVTGGNFYGNAYHGATVSDNAFVRVQNSQFHDNDYDGLSVSRYGEVRFGHSQVRANSSIVNNHRAGLSVYYNGYVSTGQYFGSYTDPNCNPFDPYAPPCPSTEQFEGGWVDLYGNWSKNIEASTGAVVWAFLTNWNLYDRVSIDATISASAFVDYDCWITGYFSHSCQGMYAPPPVAGGAASPDDAEPGVTEAAVEARDDAPTRRAREAFWLRVQHLMKVDPAQAEAMLQAKMDTSITEKSRATVLYVGLLSRRDPAAARVWAEAVLAPELAAVAMRRPLPPSAPGPGRGQIDAVAKTVLAKGLFYTYASGERDAVKAARALALLARYGDEDVASGLLAAVLEGATGTALAVPDAAALTLAPGDEEGVPAQFAVRAYPNPSRGRLTLRLALPEASGVRVVLYDVLGREVAVVADGDHNAGVHELAVDASALPAGLYLYRVVAGGRTTSGTVTLAR